MKRKMFIGSSREGLNIARIIKEEIESNCNDWLDVVIWEDGDIFTMNNNTLDCLIKVSMTYDYALLVASSDDIVLSREEQHAIARDNVVFEAGLFLGSLGKDRALMVVDKSIKLPSDYNGVTNIPYINGNMDGVFEKIHATLNKTKDSYPIKALPSAALALGYFDNYIIPFLKKRKTSSLRVIIPSCFENITSEISNYKAHNPSIEWDRFMWKRTRPIGYKYKHKRNQWWDIPTTLQTIRKLVDLLFQYSEIGCVPQKVELIKREMECFGHTLGQLIDQEKMSKDRITVEYV